LAEPGMDYGRFINRSFLLDYYINLNK